MIRESPADCLARLDLPCRSRRAGSRSLRPGWGLDRQPRVPALQADAVHGKQQAPGEMPTRTRAAQCIRRPVLDNRLRRPEIVAADRSAKTGPRAVSWT